MRGAIFATAVRKHADSIADKYILPHEHTFDYALMFVPSEEAWHYELLMTRGFEIRHAWTNTAAANVSFPVSPEHFLRIPECGGREPARTED